MAKENETTARSGDTYTILGGATVKWGVDSTSTLGTVLNCTRTDTASSEPVTNAQGAVTGLIVYDTETKISIDVVANATPTLPAMGDPITIDTIKGAVLSASLKKSSKALTMITIEISKWANMTIA